MLFRTGRPIGTEGTAGKAGAPLAHCSRFCLQRERSGAVIRHSLKILVLAGFLAGILAAPTLARAAQPPASVTLAWDNDPGSGIGGYKVYYGVASRAYTNAVSVGNTGRATINGLIAGTTYFFAVTAYGASGLESGYSAEISYTVPVPPPALTLRVTPDRQVILDGTARVGHTYDILASQNFAAWTAIDTFTVGPTGAFEFIDPAAARYPSRLYRLHEVAAQAPLPKLQIRRAPGQPFVLDGTGQVGHAYDILASPDLAVWTFITNVIVGPSGLFEFIDSAHLAGAPRFYRLHETTYTLPGTLPQLQLRVAPGGHVLLEITGQVGHRYAVLASGNLVGWTVLGTVAVGISGTSEFTDPGGNGAPRIYRLQESD